jgi:hypothetical protein
MFVTMAKFLLKARLAQRQVSEYQEGGIPFGLSYGVASTVVYHASYPESLLS